MQWTLRHIQIICVHWLVVLVLCLSFGKYLQGKVKPAMSNTEFVYACATGDLEKDIKANPYFQEVISRIKNIVS